MGESIVYALRLAFAAGIIAIIFAAFGILYSAISSIDFTGVAHEVLDLIGVFLPFKAPVVFGTIATAGTVLIGFLLAYKGFQFSKSAGEMS